METPEVDYEKEARVQNWVPQEEFKGNQDDWISAKDFVERGKQINPILRANNERLLRELDKTKQQMAEFKTTAEEFKKFQKDSYTRDVAALETQISELREEKKQAISAGDGEKTIQIEDKIDALKEEKAAAKQEQKEEKATPTTTATDPDLARWVEDNRWYAKDTSMASVANSEAERVHLLHPDLRGKDFLDKLDEALEQVFNLEKIGRKAKTPPRTMVESAGAGGGKSTSKTDKGYDNLPPEAKAACDRFIKQGLIKTREQYVNEYPW